MKSKTKKIILIVFGVLALAFICSKFKLNASKQRFAEIISLAGNGDMHNAFVTMNQTEQLPNPIANQIYQRWKRNMISRFIAQDEVIENTSKNTIINDVSNLYRAYWRSELIKGNTAERTDSILYDNIANYLIDHKLTTLSKDSLRKHIKDDTELKRVIENEGFKADFKYRNGFQELFIWQDETIEKYKVSLPKDTVNTTVVFIENYHINGYDDYATHGKSVVGGWATKETATLHCNVTEYNLDSEKFKVSYLKHESIHFTDMNDYPNLSSADLEYRAKIIELMYCTEETIYDRVAQFMNGADASDKTHSHPYANYSIIKNLSKILFDTEYESDFSKWTAKSAKELNHAAKKLYTESEKQLSKDPSANEVI